MTEIVCVKCSFLPAERGHTIDPELFASMNPCLRFTLFNYARSSNMLGDGLVPSNAMAGYLARMIARRVLRWRDLG